MTRYLEIDYRGSHGHRRFTVRPTGTLTISAPWLAQWLVNRTEMVAPSSGGTSLQSALGWVFPQVLCSANCLRPETIVEDESFLDDSGGQADAALLHDYPHFHVITKVTLVRRGRRRIRRTVLWQRQDPFAVLREELTQLRTTLDEPRLATERGLIEALLLAFDTYLINLAVVETDSQRLDQEYTIWMGHGQALHARGRRTRDRLRRTLSARS